MCLLHVCVPKRAASNKNIQGHTWTYNNNLNGMRVFSANYKQFSYIIMGPMVIKHKSHRKKAKLIEYAVNLNQFLQNCA